MVGRHEGDECGYDGCPGVLMLQEPLFFSGNAGCYCFLGFTPCSWCAEHEVRCTECCRLPDDVEIEMTMEPTLPSPTVPLREALESSLVSLDIQDDSCEQSTLLRINPELHFPLNEVFEVPDEFNGHQRGTFYYRNSGGVLRGPFMNSEEAKFDLCRRPFS